MNDDEVIVNVPDATSRDLAAELRNGQNSVLRDLLRGKPLGDILTTLAQSIERVIDSGVCSILLMDESAEYFQHVAGPHMPDEFVAAIDSLYIGPDDDVCGRAVFTKRRVIVENISSDPLCTGIRPLAAQHGLAACCAQPLIDSRGVVMGVLTVYFREPRRPTTTELNVIDDMTRLAAVMIEHKQREVALQKSNERFRSIVRNAPACICELDIHYRITGINRAGIELLASDRDDFHDIIGSNWLDLVSAEERPHIKLLVDEALDNRVVRFQFTSRPEIGSRVFLTSLNPFRNDEGLVGKLVSIAVDITERKEMEAKLRQRDAELAHVSRLTTMGEMAAELAHEINQPLYAISNYAAACISTISQSNADNAQDLIQWTRQISEQANRAGGIIRRMNEFLRKAPPEFKETDLNGLIRETLELLDVERRLHHVRIDCEFCDALPRVFVDPILMQQVLVNLLRNGIDAMHDVLDRERVITIRTNHCDEQTIQVDVADTGHGIDAETKALVFDSFYSTKDSGLGLGLTICRSAIESHQGKLWVLDGEQYGTVFRFTLPIHPSPVVMHV